MTAKELKWEWIDPKYEYPPCLVRNMDMFGNWHYALSSGKIAETCQYISLAQLELLPNEPINVDAVMKELEEKIKLTTEHGSWKGVDVDEFMAEMRGRDTDDLEKAAENYIAPIENEDGLNFINFCGRDIREAFIAGAEWQKEQMMKGVVEGEISDVGVNYLDLREIDAESLGLTDGQKVKLIIIPQDDETN